MLVRLPHHLLRAAHLTLFALALFLAQHMAARAQAGAFEVMRPADLTSPQATVRDFIAATERAMTIARRANEEQARSSRLSWSDDVAHSAADADEQLERAAEAVDFSAVPQSLLRGSKVDTVLMLYEALRRIDPKAWGPGSPQPQRAGGDTWMAWRIGESPLALTRNASGEWRFSQRNVSEAARIHARAAMTPPLWGVGGDVHREFAATAGGLVEPAWYRLLHRAPAWLMADAGGQAWWQWIAISIALSSLILAPALAHFVRMKARPQHALTQLAALLAVPLTLRVAAWLCTLALDEINIVGQSYVVLRLTLTALLYAAWLWFLVIFFTWASQSLPRLWFRDGTVEASLTRTLIRIVGVVALLFVAGRGLTLIGVPLFGVIAGLSVGGLALALAAQPTIENLIAGMMLYLDQPVRVGDICEFGAVAGVIEEIGIRSTRIRCIDGSQVTVTNSDFAKQQIRNASARRPAFTIKAQLRPNTPADAIRRVNAEIARAANAHPGVIPETTQTYLSEFDRGAPVLLAWGRIASSDMMEIERVREAVRYIVLEEVARAGLTLREDLRVA